MAHWSFDCATKLSAKPMRPTCPTLRALRHKALPFEKELLGYPNVSESPWSPIRLSYNCIGMRTESCKPWVKRTWVKNLNNPGHCFLFMFVERQKSGLPHLSELNPVECIMLRTSSSFSRPWSVAGFKFQALHRGPPSAHENPWRGWQCRWPRVAQFSGSGAKEKPRKSQGWNRLLRVQEAKWSTLLVKGRMNFCAEVFRIYLTHTQMWITETEKALEETCHKETRR